MPIYEYNCLSCGRRVEILLGVGQESGAPPRCPHCGGTDLTRVMSAPFVPRAGAKGGGGEHLCCKENKKEECVPGECCGSWPDNDDYVKLP